jgi:preprotein translocase subunit Sec61beta
MHLISMSLKRSNVSMPMSSAGIMGLSPTSDLGGQAIEPKPFVIAVIAIVLLIHVAGYFI